jgi:SPP1 gp7 family putative phage head morphogenesis protein
MNRKLWNPRMRLEQVYYSDMLDLLFQYIPAYGAVNALDFPARIEKDVLSGRFLDAVERVAAKMVTGVSFANAKTWRQAASKATRGRLISIGLEREMSGPVGVAVRRLIDQNAELISSVPLDVARSAAHFIAQSQQKGIRSETIASQLKQRIPYLTKSKLRLLARTGVSTAETTLTEARSGALGIRWYEWQTSEDARVRPSHRLMDGVLIPWATPASPEALNGERSKLGRYHAGCAPNCRCVALPLVRLDEVHWPHKVFWNDRIIMMTRAQFVQISGERIAA